MADQAESVDPVLLALAGAVLDPVAAASSLEPGATARVARLFHRELGAGGRGSSRV